LKNINKPNLFVIGAPKCGTTSIYNYLKLHPDVFLPNIKELHYFSYPEVLNTYYDVKIESDLDKYLLWYREANHKKIVGDISPSYLYNDQSAERIKSFNPEAKVIAILREPIERAISHYLMDFKIGYVNKPLNQILKDSSSYYFKEYIGNGLYYDKIKHFLEVFGNKMLILSFKEMQTYPSSFMGKIFSFLEIQPIEIDYSLKYNSYAHPNTRILYYLRILKLYKIVNTITPVFIKDFAKGLIESNKYQKPNCIYEKKLLQKFFINDSEQLNKLLGSKLW